MHFRTLSLLVLLLVLGASAGFAQTTSGSIAGNVNDPQQAAISGATVTLNDETKAFGQPQRLRRDQFGASAAQPATLGAVPVLAR